MAKNDIIIIGGGAAGLIAALTLAAAGRKVLILEGRDRLGGRIHTLNNGGFSQPAETGAEFLHGRVPLTRQLLKDAGIGYEIPEGDMLEHKDGKLQEAGHEPHYKEVVKKLKNLEQDMSVATFLEEYLEGEKYAPLRDRVRGMVEGYEAADIDKAGIMGVREDLISDHSEEQGRVNGGYGQLIDYLAEQCRKNGCDISLSSIVKNIDWQQDNVTVTVGNGNVYTAPKVIITIPLGVLQSQSVSFQPSIPQYEEAIQKMGFGEVIKILLEFKDHFWEQAADDTEIGFVLAQTAIPTWWTQYPTKSNLLTGWLGGPASDKMMKYDDDALTDIALDSLSDIFKISKEELKGLLAYKHICRWSSDPFAMGAYSYITVDGEAAIQQMKQPIENTIYFAGEAIYDGDYKGTVEAALVSGKEAAEKTLRQD